MMLTRRNKIITHAKGESFAVGLTLNFPDQIYRYHCCLTSGICNSLIYRGLSPLGSLEGCVNDVFPLSINDLINNLNYRRKKQSVTWAPLEVTAFGHPRARGAAAAAAVWRLRRLARRAARSPLAGLEPFQPNSRTVASIVQNQFMSSWGLHRLCSLRSWNW